MIDFRVGEKEELSLFDCTKFILMQLIEKRTFVRLNVNEWSIYSVCIIAELYHFGFGTIQSNISYSLICLASESNDDDDEQL